MFNPKRKKQNQEVDYEDDLEYQSGDRYITKTFTVMEGFLKDGDTTAQLYKKITKFANDNSLTIKFISKNGDSLGADKMSVIFEDES